MDCRCQAGGVVVAGRTNLQVPSGPDVSSVRTANGQLCRRASGSRTPASADGGNVSRRTARSHAHRDVNHLSAAVCALTGVRDLCAESGGIGGGGVWRVGPSQREQAQPLGLYGAVHGAQGAVARRGSEYVAARSPPQAVLLVGLPAHHLPCPPPLVPSGCASPDKGCRYLENNDMFLCAEF